MVGQAGPVVLAEVPEPGEWPLPVVSAEMEEPRKDRIETAVVVNSGGQSVATVAAEAPAAADSVFAKGRFVAPAMESRWAAGKARPTAHFEAAADWAGQLVAVAAAVGSVLVPHCTVPLKEASSRAGVGSDAGSQAG